MLKTLFLDQNAHSFVYNISFAPAPSIHVVLLGIHEPWSHTISPVQQKNIASQASFVWAMHQKSKKLTQTRVLGSQTCSKQGRFFSTQIENAHPQKASEELGNEKYGPHIDILKSQIECKLIQAVFPERKLPESKIAQKFDKKQRRIFRFSRWKDGEARANYCVSLLHLSILDMLVCLSIICSCHVYFCE